MPCDICGGEQYEAEPHETWEHSEAWVSMADARYTGEVIFMPAHLVFAALEALDIYPQLDTRVKTHVDRNIVIALLDSLEYVDDDGGVAKALATLLADNPEREPLD